MKIKKIIIILAIVLVIVIVGIYLYNKYKLYKENQGIATQLSADQKYNAMMREKYKDIKNVDEFIASLKYLDNSAPFGYNIANLESSKAKLSGMVFADLKKLQQLLYKGIEKNSDKDNLFVMQTLPKLF
jgi:hypothetical protein